MKFFGNLRRNEWPTIVDWLLRNQNTSGGWSYRVGGSSNDEALSTAACLAALSYFQSTGEGTDPQIKLAAKRGWDTLLSLRKAEGLWPGYNPGQNDIEDTANIIDLFSQKEIREGLISLGLKPMKVLEEGKKALRRVIRGSGWPRVVGGEAALDATIAVLVATLYDYADKENDRQHLIVICAALIDQMRNQDGGLRLQSWDWAMLARLSSMILTSVGDKRLQDDNYRELRATIASIQKDRRFPVQVVKAVWLKFPQEAQRPLLFILSKGERDEGKLQLKLARMMMELRPHVSALTAIAKKVFAWISPRTGQKN